MNETISFYSGRKVVYWIEGTKKSIILIKNPNF